MGLSLSLFSCRWRPSQVKGREEPRRDARDLRPSPFLSFYLLPTHNTNLAMPGTFFLHKTAFGLDRLLLLLFGLDSGCIDVH